MSAYETMAHRRKKERPISVGQVCGHLTADYFSTDRCHESVAGARCPDILRGIYGPDLLEECHTCQAYGDVQSRLCTSCKGQGWVLRKARIWRRLAKR
jgi:hypothetical protein